MSGWLISPDPLHGEALNRVVTKQFRWRIATTPHFEVYYYDEGKPILPRVIHYLEHAYQRVTTELEYEPPGKTPFFLYVTQNDFQQTSIASIGDGVGGLTEGFKNRFLIPHLGSEFWLEQVITHEFVHVVQFNVLLNGFWKSARLVKTVFNPLWVIEGMAEYGTGDLDRSIHEMVIRDAATSGKLIPLQQLQNFAHLKPHQVTLAYKEGDAAMEYLAKTYGRKKVVELLKALRDRFEISAILRELTGKDFRQFDAEFRTSLENRYAPLTKTLHEPSQYGRPLTNPGALPQFNTNPVFSPDGQRIAYLSDRTGYPDVYVLDLETNREVPLDIRRFLRRVDRISTRGSALSWSPNGRWLAFAGRRAGKDALFLYDLRHRRLRRYRVKLDAVAEPVFTPDGQSLVFVGMRNGQTDLYRYVLKERRVLALTNDPWDDSNPAVSPDGRYVVFSSERIYPERTVRTAQRELFLLDLTRGDITQLTDLPFDETAPSFTPDGRGVVFVSDQDGIFDLYRIDLETRAVIRLTHTMGGHFDPKVSPDGRWLIFSAYRGGERHLYLGTLPYAGPYTKSQQVPEVAASSSTAPASLILSEHPYRLRDGFPSLYQVTDFFFPALFFSSADGLFAAGTWQGSSMLGNHRVTSSAAYASANGFLDYQVAYFYSRYRPEWFFAARGSAGDDPGDRRIRRSVHTPIVGMTYPLDRFHSIEVAVRTSFRRDRFDQFGGRVDRSREDTVRLGFFRDTVTGPYLEETSGSRFLALFDRSSRALRGNIEFFSQRYEWHQFLPASMILPESAMALRLLGAVSVGRDQESFRLGGVDRVRGLGSFNRASRVAVANLEYRFPIVRDLNFHLAYFLPDLLFKRLSGALFTDVGYQWNTSTQLTAARLGDLTHTAGVGLRLHTFILQTFRLVLSLDWAKRLDAPGSIFYFSLGPAF
ncbi:MAG: PD40 domain-containing protein [Elusimicrobia bacterium]|nr:PD40 domain-containing protein [Elusimicrobiota bacterium]